LREEVVVEEEEAREPFAEIFAMEMFSLDCSHLFYWRWRWHIVYAKVRSMKKQR
jgi:hypothetical protein